jgi:hypothetical protein
MDLYDVRVPLLGHRLSQRPPSNVPTGSTHMRQQGKAGAAYRAAAGADATLRGAGATRVNGASTTEADTVAISGGYEADTSRERDLDAQATRGILRIQPTLIASHPQYAVPSTLRRPHTLPTPPGSKLRGEDNSLKFTQLSPRQANRSLGSSRDPGSCRAVRASVS